MKRLIRILILGVLLALVAGGAMIASLRASYRGFADDQFVTIERGAGTATIGQQLANAGVIRYPWQLTAARALDRVLGTPEKIQAGEYRFSQAASAEQVVARMARGDVYFFEFTVKEGENIFDIAQSLEQSSIMKAADFLSEAKNPALIHDLAPSAPSLEGYLFPSTYRLSHSTTAADLCREMTDQFRKQWRKVAKNASADPQRIVTIASMVEKETGVAKERPLVAGVFVNRLEKGMKLDCDPTTVYAALLENRFRSVIHKSDLASQNPYNTYQHAGLPPGPIANPGSDAIAAALEPAATDYLYFVAKPEGGGHNFSSTLAAHDRATQAYRKKTKKAG
jgi:UPF0755 protein